MMECTSSTTDWQFRGYLNEGAFGSVSLWYNPVKQQSVAIKKCHLNLNDLDPDQREKTKERWMKEIDLLRTLNPSSHIVGSCAEICADLIAEQNQHTALPVIAMEYCDGGNLRQKLEKIENINGFSEYDVCQVLFAIKEALNVLHHQHHITHRDIKPENVVIKIDAQGKPVYKLADMGYARGLDRETIECSLVGTRKYSAPEIVREGEYKNSVDYWSFAIVGFEIACGVNPILPYQPNVPLKTILEVIFAKPTRSISVTKSVEGKVVYHYQLFRENRLSGAFRRNFEEWLQIGLETDGRRRGYEQPAADSHSLYQDKPQFTLFSRIDQMVQAKQLTIFWVNRSKFLSYTVYDSMVVEKLHEAIEKDIEISRRNYDFILPTVHQLTYLPANVRPIELWDEKLFMNDKPMLYLVDFETSDLFKPEDPCIPEMVIHLFNAGSKMGAHSLYQCLMNALFFIQHESRRMHACVDGLKEYYMVLEERLIQMSKHFMLFQRRTALFEGQKMQYEMMANELSQRGLVNGFQVSTSSNDEDYQIMRSLDVDWQHSKEVLDNTSKIVLNSELDHYSKEIQFFREKFEKDFKDIRNRSISEDSIKCLVSSFLKELSELYKNISAWMHNRNTENCSPFDIHKRFWTIKSRNVVENSHSWWDKTQARMRSKTTEYVDMLARRLQQNDDIMSTNMECVIDDMDDLKLDNVPLSFDPTTRVLLNNMNNMINGLEPLLRL